MGQSEGFSLSGGGGDWKDALAQRLYAQRVVMLAGPLDDMLMTRVSAELMALDAEGDDPVTLRVDCGEGALALGLTLMDIIELLGVPVRALCLGQVGGPAIGVVAVCSHRAAMPSTRFALREPSTQLEAHVRDVEQWAALRSDERARFCRRVADAAGRPLSAVTADLSRGIFLSAPEAQAYGLIDEVCRLDSDAQIRPMPSPSIGFRPLR
jgi:ATP-dependent Clp protease, protease subunit